MTVNRAESAMGGRSKNLQSVSWIALLPGRLNLSWSCS